MLEEKFYELVKEGRNDLQINLSSFVKFVPQGFSQLLVTIENDKSTTKIFIAIFSCIPTNVPYYKLSRHVEITETHAKSKLSNNKPYPRGLKEARICINTLHSRVKTSLKLFFQKLTEDHEIFLNVSHLTQNFSIFFLQSNSSDTINHATSKKRQQIVQY